MRFLLQDKKPVFVVEQTNMLNPAYGPVRVDQLANSSLASHGELIYIHLYVSLNFTGAKNLVLMEEKNDHRK